MRIEFSDSKIRLFFFRLIKNNTGCTWKELEKKLGITRSSFERYRSGYTTIPEAIFFKLFNILDDPAKGQILQKIKRVPGNWGQVQGGKSAYLINNNSFVLGRKKGLSIIKLLRQNKEKNENKEMEDILSSFTVSPQICEVIGAFIGDGCFNCYNNRVYHVEFSGDSRKDLSYYTSVIIPAINAILPDIHPHMYTVKSRNTLRVVFYSKKLFTLLKEGFGFVPGKKTYTVTIPKRILCLDKPFIYFTIKGIFDTDGGVFCDNRRIYNAPYPRIIFSTVSKGLYDQIYRYLSDDFSLYTGFDKRRNVYKIEIYGIDQLKKWMSLIGFSNKRHLDRLAPVAQFWK